MPGSAAIRPRSHKFTLEIAAACLLTAGAVVLVARYATAAPPPARKVAAQAPALAPATGAGEEARVAEFMERFALSRVATPGPEPDVIATPLAGVAAGAAIAAGKAARDQRPRASAAPQKPNATPVPLPPQRAASERRPARPAEAPARLAEAPRPPADIAAAEAKPARHIPIVSTIVEKIPSGRDIVQGVSSLGRRVGSIFSRG